MFDIGFSELLVIAVVALLVIGPERLPKVARTAGHLFGRLQRYVNDVKADIQREIELEELKKLRSQFEDAARSVQESVSEVDQQVRAVGDDLNRAAADLAAEPARAPSAAATTETGALPPPSAGSPETPKPSSEAKV
ncbi:MAG TPA: Sec-independent protein translocase protein TatB [Burkholderiales bacterium]|nr:Sec-independent protein translocase protein TatB [Burkholderiales bacterium]